MDDINWTAFGFTAEEADTISTLRKGPDTFDLGRELRLWTQWVRELERQERWTLEELHAAWNARDDLEESLELLSSDEQQRKLFSYLDAVDRSFRDHTVLPAEAEAPDGLRWWRGRIPVGNGPRRYLD